MFAEGIRAQGGVPTLPFYYFKFFFQSPWIYSTLYHLWITKIETFRMFHTLDNCQNNYS